MSHAEITKNLRLGSFIKYVCKQSGKEDGVPSVWLRTGREGGFCPCAYILCIRIDATGGGGGGGGGCVKCDRNALLKEIALFSKYT